MAGMQGGTLAGAPGAGAGDTYLRGQSMSSMPHVYNTKGDDDGGVNLTVRNGRVRAASHSASMPPANVALLTQGVLQSSSGHPSAPQLQ